MASQLDFEILITINGISYSDITYCAFVRSPIIKQSSFCLIKLFFSQILLRQMMADIDKNKFTKCKMTIYAKDEHDRGNINIIFIKSFLCIKAIPEGAIRFQEERMFATFVLVHPTLLYLNTNNTYNKLFLDTTASGVLSSFEGYLTTYFGDIFNFIKVGTSVQQNNFIYEQILTRTNNDLNIPTYLINNFKTNHSFNYYFFDPFYITDSHKMEIANLHINLQDEKQFKQVDVFKYFDRKLMANKIAIKNFSDINQTFFGKNGNRIILNHQEIKFIHEKEPKITGLDKKLTPISNDFEMVDGRKIKTVSEKGSTGVVYPGSSSITTLYCPDDVGNGQTRFDNGLQLITDKIMGFQYYEMTNCLPDFPQFGEIYNLEEDNKSNYILTPLNIVNVFVRKNQREHYLYHLAKTVMIRYKNS